MIYAVRHLLAILILPVSVTVLIPIWIARRSQAVFTPPATPVEWLLAAAGSALFPVGLALFVACVARFAGEGRGTLAPWDPPQRLVVRGAYRYVRNPMISGVILILVAEALLLRSRPHALWALAFVAMNAIWIPLFEEPQLERRFGHDYRRYKRHVRRFLPRIPPWTPG